jgi:hypothetical protein
MSRLWTRAFEPEFDTHPLRTWFWSATLAGFIALAPGLYEFYKIGPENGHKEQLVFRSPINHAATETWALTVRAGIIYILTYPDDVPNWGTPSGLVAISPPCGNWNSNLYETTELIRSQTWGILAAIQGNRERAAAIRAVIAKTGSLDIGVKAAIQAAPDLAIGQYAAIQGEPIKYTPIRAAIRSEMLLEPSILAAVAQDFSLADGISAIIQGNVDLHSHLKAAVLGENEKSVGITAWVVKSRVDQILVEMENNIPQEFDNRIPNWPSGVKDYRKSSLSARDS